MQNLFIAVVLLLGTLCISCGACESICPEVFEVPDKMVVKEDADFNTYEMLIVDAANDCPTEVIRYE